LPELLDEPIVSVDEAICNALLAMLRNRGIHAVRVTGYKEEKLYGGYCETCYYEQYVVEIYYLTETGVFKEYEYDGQFADLLRELTQ
jgi:hypothetical protein